MYMSKGCNSLKYIICFVSVVFLYGNAQSQVVINEMMSNNQSAYTDEDGDYSDWLELYNMGGTPVNLNGFGLSDNPDSLLRWQFPNYTLNPGAFLLIWCSGKDRDSIQPFHTNFSIDSRGEPVFLSDNAGNVLDNFTAVYLPQDISFGRITDGSAGEYYLSVSSPGYSNNGTGTYSGAIADKPAFTIPGGLYTTAQQVGLSCLITGAEIRYTLDGSDPVETSPLYIGPLTVDSRAADTNYYSTIRTCYQVHLWLPDWYPPQGNVFKANIIRARIFKTGYLPGPVMTQTYFVDPAMMTRYGNLPVISIVSDPKNLFNDTTGIYVPGITYQPGTFFANYYEDWHRPANVEMYEPGGVQAFNSNFKISINGVSSRSSSQKGLNINASGDFGDTKISWPLFAGSETKAKYISKFDKIKIRAWGSDRNSTLFRDAFAAELMGNSMDEVEAYRPVVVFIDGEYWGLQEMRERNRNGSWFQEHFLIDKDNPGFDILDDAGATVIEGDQVSWNAIKSFMDSNTMSDSAAYAYACTQIDIRSFMLNYMSSIYFSRGDWPGQNEAVWKPKMPGKKWRWIQWDMDNIAGFYLNPWYDCFNQAIVGSRGYGPSDLFVNFLQNTGFRNDFINLFADYMNTDFLPALLQAKVDSMKNVLLPYITEYQNRWQTNYTWINQVDSMKWWLGLRQQFCRQQILTTWSLPAQYNLTLNVSDTAKGNIRVSTIFLDKNTRRINPGTYPWSGIYFQSVPVPVTAIAKPGYRFVEWLPSHDTTASLFMDLMGDTILTAVFDPDPSYRPVLLPVINEVMSSNGITIPDNYGEYDDWIEIYNPNNDTLDLAGWFLTDNLVLPTRFELAIGNDSTKIPPYGYMLLWADDDTEQGVLHTNFKLNETGDFVALYKPDGETLVDSIRFGVLPPDVSAGRSSDAAPDWVSFASPTPGQTNNSVPLADALFNEVMLTNINSITDEHGMHSDWIELYNPSTDTLNLSGWFVSDDQTQVLKYRLPYSPDSLKIAPQGFLMIWADSNTEKGVRHVPFSLPPTGVCLSLYKPDGTTYSDGVCVNPVPADQTFGRKYDGSTDWIVFIVPTPVAPNWIYTSEQILINEIETQNTNTVSDNYGDYDPWAELYNPNGDTLNIEGWFFTDNPGVLNKYRFVYGSDSTKIPPGDFLLLWGDGQTAQGSTHLGFIIPSSAACLILSKPDRTFSDSACYGIIPAGHSYGRTSDGNTAWMDFDIPTPDSNNVDLSAYISVIEAGQSLVLYPNPAHSGRVRLNRVSDIRLTDLPGRPLKYFRQTSLIDVSDLIPGIYILTDARGNRAKLVVE